MRDFIRIAKDILVFLAIIWCMIGLILAFYKLTGLM